MIPQTRYKQLSRKNNLYKNNTSSLRATPPQLRRRVGGREHFMCKASDAPKSYCAFEAKSDVFVQLLANGIDGCGPAFFA
jgi:hypothetical protein